MFRADGATPVLVDFALVRNLGHALLTPTWLVQGPGTPYFASPEQLNNDKSMIDWRADQFSLAISVAMARFGIHPFAVAGDDLAATVGRVAARAGPTASFDVQAAAEGLGPLVRMVQPWPVQRFRVPNDLAGAWRNQ